MSEERNSNETVECHESRLPKSLQGMENADVLWQMITKRFPNAAPLLCEMEAVIDRADDLLRQLRTPCTKSVETSSFNAFVDSEESDNIISLICDESFPEDTDMFEDVPVMMNTVETAISESNIFTIDSDFDSLEKSNDFPNEIHCNEHEKENSSSPVIESRSERTPFSSSTTQTQTHTSTYTFLNVCNITISNSPNVYLGSFSKINEATSLESWGKLVDNETESIKSPHSTNEQNETKSNKTVVTKVFERIQKNEKKNSSGDWEDNVRETNSCTREDSQEIEIHKNVNHIDNNEDQIFGDDSGLREINCKTPQNILEEYAKQCNMKIEYHCEKNKCNRYVITGKLSEFSATGCCEDQELAKNIMAKRILQNLVDHQMNDKDMKHLSEFSREQILEILNFGNDETVETPLRKVYMYCLKEGAPPPKYITEVEYTYQGLKCVAKCIALDHMTEGHRVSCYNAKKAAAEEFFKKYGPKET